MYIGGTDEKGAAPPLRRGHRQFDGRGRRRPRDRIEVELGADGF
jgi:hypothetical protein